MLATTQNHQQLNNMKHSNPPNPNPKTKLTCFFNSFFHLLGVLVMQLNLFWIELAYFITISTLGFIALKLSTGKTSSFVPNDLDLFFTSVSSVTVSSMSTVEMEAFSNAQLILMTVLMFLGGEVFTSLLALQLMKSKKKRNKKIENDQNDQVELGIQDPYKPLEEGCFGILSSVIVSYLFVVHLLGVSMILIYFEIIQSAKKVLGEKGLNPVTFAFFTIVSTFTNCGFIPTNENMMIFKKNSGLLLILIPQILLGNTLYPAFLRVFISILRKITKREEMTFLLENPKALGYGYLYSKLHSIFLALTAFGFVVVQLVAFLAMEWQSDSTAGLSGYEKVVGSLFQVVNSRHGGESIVDLSLLAPAMIVLFVLMMYMPPHTCFLPINKDAKGEQTKNTRRSRKSILSNLLFSQLTYLVIFTILICITEKEKMEEDPLNFTLLNIVVEVIGSYGNVGFSMGYSCKRQIKVGGSCKDALFGFAGRFSPAGKFIIIAVMIFGRLKNFNMRSHKAWRFQ